MINDSGKITNDISFYRSLDNNNKFPNQTRDPITAVYEDKEMYFGENDTQPEPYFAEDRENVDFDNFTGFAKSVKKTL